MKTINQERKKVKQMFAEGKTKKVRGGEGEGGKPIRADKDRGLSYLSADDISWSW